MAGAPADYNQPQERGAGMLGCHPTDAGQDHPHDRSEDHDQPSLDFDRRALPHRVQDRIMDEGHQPNPTSQRPDVTDTAPPST